MITKNFVILLILSINLVNGYFEWDTPNQALDQDLYESVIDPELCRQQMSQVLRDSLLRLRFADAGIRTPRGILGGNNVDLGNYHQCLGITEEVEGAVIQGKYCMIRVPMSQGFEFPNSVEVPEFWPDYDSSIFHLNNETLRGFQRYHNQRETLKILTGQTVGDSRLTPGVIAPGTTFRLAICIPSSCSTEQAINSVLFNRTAIGFQYSDDFCRLPNDKPWVPGDYVAVVIFSIFGIVTLISTCYDLAHRFISKKNPNSIHIYASAFSMYTNGRRLMTFTSSPGTLECVDGIRALAMAFVVLGHAFTSVPFWANPFDSFIWSVQPEAMWIQWAHLTVDTFFMLSGMLVVYTTAGKLNGRQLLSNLHLFYLNRLLRMFPLLAAVVLLEASYFNRMADGPVWSGIVGQAHRCRTFWWSTLLHVQNYMNRGACIGQSWYLAIDVQLHIISPLVLYWVLSGKNKKAWIALMTALIAILAGSTIFNYYMDFPPGMSNATDAGRYMTYYYINTLTRGSPFFVGMIFGYILHLYRGMEVKLSQVAVCGLWASAAGFYSITIYASYPILQFDWNSSALSLLFNSFIRPMWAAGLGCTIFVCAQGYGGPVNWFLSLQIWKLPARISYGIYLLHWALMTVINATEIAPVYFSPGSVVFKCLAHLTLSFVVSFFMTLIVDSPFSTLFKLILGQGSKKPKETKETEQDEPVKNDEKLA